MLTRPLEKRDYDLIVQVIDRWWGGPTSALAHPIFFYELGEMGRIVEDDGVMVGFLLGFIARSGQGGDVGYVHLVGIHPDHRRRGVGRLLYEAFEEDCRKTGASRMKAITTLGNEGSQVFHQVLGWDMSEVEDYAGPGRPRIVFTKDFAQDSRTRG
ncbi:MAG TPA: GNAT family N-acetyltransferase [Polyangiaceae bacterium]|nr:GNAT family N-acetyltransferase [Polyangiaceae bacterium]